MANATIEAEYANTAVGRDIRILVGHSIHVHLLAARYRAEDDRIVLELLTPLLDTIVVGVSPDTLIELVTDPEASL